jgi:hypothetical protein
MDLFYIFFTNFRTNYSFIGVVTMNKRHMKDIPIHRRTKKEAEQAISDLEARGFIVTFPLTEIKSFSETRGKYDYQRGKYSFNEAGVSTYWAAKLRRVEES